MTHQENHYGRSLNVTGRRVVVPTGTTVMVARADANRVALTVVGWFSTAGAVSTEVLPLRTPGSGSDVEVAHLGGANPAYRVDMTSDGFRTIMEHHAVNYTAGDLMVTVWEVLEYQQRPLANATIGPTLGA